MESPSCVFRTGFRDSVYWLLLSKSEGWKTVHAALEKFRQTALLLLTNCAGNNVGEQAACGSCFANLTMYVQFDGEFNFVFVSAHYHHSFDSLLYYSCEVCGEDCVSVFLLHRGSFLLQLRQWQNMTCPQKSGSILTCTWFSLWWNFFKTIRLATLVLHIVFLNGPNTGIIDHHCVFTRPHSLTMSGRYMMKPKYNAASWNCWRRPIWWTLRRTRIWVYTPTRRYLSVCFCIVLTSLILFFDFLRLSGRNHCFHLFLIE